MSGRDLVVRDGTSFEGTDAPSFDRDIAPRWAAAAPRGRAMVAGARND